MVANSAISWTDHTWNPWIGCTKVSPACDFSMHGGAHGAFLHAPGNGALIDVVKAPATPIALCIALVRSLIHLEEGKQNG